MPTAPGPMHSLDWIAADSDSSRGTILNRMKAYDDAVAKGEMPPKGSLRSIRWGGKYLIADSWYRQSLGIDDAPVPCEPRRKGKPRGKPFPKLVPVE